MERAKLGLLGLIAVALWLGLLRDWMPEARASSPTGAIQCNAWYVDIPITFGAEKTVTQAKLQAQEIADWMAQHPGDPVFRTTMARTAPMSSIPTAYVETLCVR